MKAVKITHHKVSGCKDRQEAIDHLTEIYGGKAEFDITNSQRFAEEGWTFWVGVIEEVEPKKGKKES